MLKTWKTDQKSNLMNEQNSFKSKPVSKITELKLQTINIQKTSLEIEKSIAFLNGQYDDIINQMESLQGENHAYMDKIQSLETKIQDLRQLSRSSTFNMPQIK